MKTPLLSIIIANYNYGRFLESAIQSVLQQSCTDYELIIVDGGSTDNSIDIIKKYADHLRWWVSEKDNGQSEAFNKGFAKASGRFMTWLNADDLMLPDAIAKLKFAANKSPQQEWFAGGSVHFGPDMRIILCTHSRRFSTYEAKHGQISVYSPSTFFTKSLYNRVGGIDEFYRFMMDTDLWSKFFLREGTKFQVLPGYIFGFRYHAASKTTCVHFKSEKSKEKEIQDREQGRRENERIRALFPPYNRMCNLVRLLRMDWNAKIRSLFDTWRCKGLVVTECRQIGY